MSNRRPRTFNGRGLSVFLLSTSLMLATPGCSDSESEPEPSAPSDATSFNAPEDAATMTEQASSVDDQVEVAPLPVLDPLPPVRAVWGNEVLGAWPPRRLSHVAVLDEDLQQVVMFGGLGGQESVLAQEDTWLWDDTTMGWQLTAHGLPTARWNAAIGWCGNTNQVVLFGGRGGSVGAPVILNDTWTWNRQTRRWQAVGVGGPMGRDCAAMCWDRKNRNVVMFGGRDSSSSIYPDTWIFDGESWTAIRAPGPPARFDHEMVFDERLGRVVMFGGEGSGGRKLNDMWAWNGLTWEPLTPAAGSPVPEGRSLHAMGYDPVQQRIVISGGWDQYRDIFDDLWAWDGTRWESLNTGLMFARLGHTMSWSPRLSHFIIFGGRGEDGIFADTWQLHLEPANGDTVPSEDEE